MSIYDQGWNDYFNEISECPYMDNTDEAESWKTGWFDAENDDRLNELAFIDEDI